MMKRILETTRLKVWGRYVALNRRAPELRYLFWETTRRCNLSCRHCGSFCDPSQREEELTAEEVIAFFRRVAEKQNPRRVMVAITGGEPLVCPHLVEVCSALKGMGFRMGMVTNGVLAAKETVRDLGRAGMTSVTVSLDGLQANHDWLRGEGVFQKALRALELFRDDPNFRIVEAFTAVTRRSFEDLPALRDTLHRLGIKRWRACTMMPIGRAEKDPDLTLDPRLLKDLLEFIKDHRARRRLPDLQHGCEGFLGPEYEGKVRPYLYQCHAGVAIASLRANGDYGACPDIPEELSQGNLRAGDDFWEAWENKYEFFRRPRRSNLCGDCTWFSTCGGGGAHLWDCAAQDLKACKYKMLQEIEETT